MLLLLCFGSANCVCVLIVWILRFSLDCKDVICYTQLTKLLNWIALLGIFLFCGNLTLSISFINYKMLWDWIFLWHTCQKALLIYKTHYHLMLLRSLRGCYWPECICKLWCCWRGIRRLILLLPNCWRKLINPE